MDEQGDATGKYRDNKDFLRRTLGFATRELAATPLAFDYVKLTTQPRRAGRSRVVALRFILRATKLTHLPGEWLQHPLTSKILAAMRRYKVSEQNMLAYLPLLGSQQALALVAEWDAKERSRCPIKDRQRYCNHVLVKLGKARQMEQWEQQRQQQLAKRAAKRTVRAILAGTAPAASD